jgi:hypothetical protein
MTSKFSKFGIILAITGIVLYMTVLRYWSFRDGASLVLAPYYAKILSAFSTAKEIEPSFVSAGFSLTENVSIYMTAGIVFSLGLAAIFLSLKSIRRHEVVTYTVASLLLGNAVFMLYSFKVALVTLVISGIYAVYLKSRLTSA